MSEIKVIPSKIEREFNAPRQLVFDAWTQVEHLNNWMFPMPGCSCEYVSADIKDGGTSLHKITMPNGHEMWLFTKFEEVRSPEKLVFLQYMSNAEGEIVHMKHVPNWPKDMLATLTFEETLDGKTKLTFLWEPRNPTVEELQAFEATRSDHDKGWGAGMAQLEAYLATL
ncbi:SRPBCC domain-containing protein [Terasakiella sp. A23]|uniref:SRPBCC family protein n=1 Tax=Terasakiella sp. FCG-A23 TaxID=3080561 RepID=UPI002954D22A|nr:SRPBCC domain-containing protein [Terasakiella sp. A23]MDV7338126.1 SRPBCC domain-containing protein [Terasakiella sp. A23]